jgi:AsmA protein
MKAAKFVTIVIAVGLVGLLLLLMLGVPAGFLAKTIERYAKTDLGYEVRIDGTVKLGLWPSPTVAVREVSLLDLGDPNQRNLFGAEAVRITTSFQSLFAGHPQITEIAVERPTLPMRLHRERTDNDQGRSERSAISADKLTQPLSVERITVEEGTLLLSEENHAPRSRIDHVNLTASRTASGGYLDVNIGTNGGGGTVLRFRASANTLPESFAGQSIPVDIKFEVPGLLQDPLLATAQVGLSASTLMFNGVQGTIGQSKLNGWASVDLVGKPLIKLDLDVRRLNLASSLASSGNADQSANGTRPWSDQPIDMDGINFFDADVSFSAGELNIGNFRMGPISIKSTIDRGVLRAVFPNAPLYDGEAEGTIVVDSSGPVANESLQCNLSGVRALPVLSDVLDFQALDGRMWAKLQLSASGTTERAVVSALSGTVDVLFRDGEIRGLNVAQMIRNLTSSPLDGWQEKAADRTDLTELSAVFQIDRGRAETDNVRLIGPLVRVTGTGSADLSAKTLQFRLEPSLVLSLEGQGRQTEPLGLGVPVVVEGPWSEPHIYPNIPGILDNPDAAYEKLRTLGTGLFGNNATQPGGPVDKLMQGLGTIFNRSGSDDKNGESPKPNDATKDNSQNPTAGSKQSRPQDGRRPLSDIVRDLLGR